MRTLFSLDGGRTLRPFELLDDAAPIRCRSMSRCASFNYWAEGFACFSNEPQPAAALAALLLDNALSAIKPGVPLAQLRRSSRSARPTARHPVTQSALAIPIGLVARRAADRTELSKPARSIRCAPGSPTALTQHAIVSAMIAVRDDGAEMLWRSGIASARTTT